MIASTILAHPYPKSYNHAIFDTVNRTLAELGVTVYMHDLYLEKFDPVLTRNELGTDASDDPLVNKYAV